MKWMDTRVAIALIASLSLAVAPACSDDTGGQENDNQAQEDAGGDVGDAGDTDIEDTGDDADAGGDEDADTGADADTDTSDSNDNQFDVEPVECAYPASDLDECDEEEGDFGPASFFSKFVIETSDDEGEQCCFDIDGQGGIDNYIGEELVEIISAIDGFDDINENIATSIQSGELTYLLEGYRWDHPKWDNDLEFRVYKGGSSEGDYMEGQAEFEVSPANFDDDGEPLYGFESVEIRDGALAAEDGHIKIMLPGLVDALGAELDAVQMTGRIEQSPEPDLEAEGQFEITEGRLGGALMRDTFFKSLNEESLGCECLELDADTNYSDPDLYEDGLFTFNEPHHEDHPGSWNCDGKAEPGDACQDSTDPVCYTLGDESLCTGLSFISDQTDIEIDGEHAFSVGAHFEAVTATIVGIDDE